MHTLLTTLKSWYAKGCILSAVFTWLLLFGFLPIAGGLQLLLMRTGFQSKTSESIVLWVVGAALLAVVVFAWNRVLGQLDVDEVVNSTKVTVGLALLTIALIAFPGTFVGPMIVAWLSGDPNQAAMAYLSLVGVPVFLVVSIVGLLLAVPSPAKKLVASNLPTEGP